MEFNGTLLIACADEMCAEDGHTQRMTLHCLQCSTVLGDSFSACGECVDSIVCLSVTDDVVVSDAMKSGHKGEMARCISSSLKCRGCGSAVGSVIHSAPPPLAAVRSMFLLQKKNISCYILNRRSMVKASTLTFDMKPLRESMNETQQHFEAQMDRISHIKSRLADRIASVS
ncbi:hypothetical protein CgunFtcFv8_012204 [Champsocephalus gunnari]|uniref:Mis18 domain-containing protein n=1 Tax=Champsocephalus gunnari TaxID=52237 RepID=A0AAN8HJ62_CHAGU|nr:hypothetical protein CgunFtcFv8_012204 [Champsocephalus gunnari]